jgi:hypothetical protein
VFFATLKMGRTCDRAIFQGSPNALSRKIGDGWLVQIEHDHKDLDRTGTFTFWYKIVSDPNKATFGCRQGFNELN